MRKVGLMVRWPVWLEDGERGAMPTAQILTPGNREVKFRAGSEPKEQKCKETYKATNRRKMGNKQTKR
jgi:hypothetical protein